MIPEAPRKATSLLRWFCKPSRLEEVEGDLLEAFLLRCKDGEIKKAKRKYWWDVMISFNATNIRYPSLLGTLHSTQISMYKNYFKTLIRSIQKSKAYTAISVASLLIALTSFSLIFIYLENEFSYDRFYSNSENIYRIAHERIGFGNTRTMNFAPLPLAPHLHENYEEVVEFSRVFNYRRAFPLTVRESQLSFNEARFGWVDPAFFKLFDRSFVYGNKETALSRPNTITMSRSTATKYFGETDPIGQILQFDGTDGAQLEVTGVYEDFPTNSHFGFDLVSNIVTAEDILWHHSDWIKGWENLFVAAYIQVNDGADMVYLSSKIDQIMDEKVSTPTRDLNPILQPLTTIHLHSNLDLGEFKSNGNKTTIYLFGAIGLVILFLGCFNFINMATAQSTKRFKEIGLRKIFGSKKRHFLQQYYFETLVFVLLAMALSIGIIYVCLPFFSNFTEQNYEISDLLSFSYLLTLVGVVIFTCIIAGTYPALSVSRFNPIRILRLKNITGRSGATVRNFFIVAQFVISVGLIIVTTVIYTQLNFMKQKKLGFDNDQIVSIPIQNDDIILPKLDLIKDKWQNHPGIRGSNAQSHLLFTDYTYVNSFQMTGSRENLGIERYTVDHDFLKTFDINLIAGRDFSPVFKTDSSAIILNQSAAKAFGMTPEEIIGKTILNVTSSRAGKVVGVTRDFHFRSMHEKIQPFILQVDLDRLDYFSVKLSASDLNDGLLHLQKSWEETFPSLPFFYEFHDQEFAELYRREERQGTLFATFTIIAIFLGCLGLFGFALFTTQSRVKEIGIRKVLGAKSLQITALLATNFLRLVFISYLISIPLAWYFVEQWLSSFAYRIEVPVWIFLLACFATGLMAIITVSFQTLKAAWSNPKDNLRYE